MLVHCYAIVPKQEERDKLTSRLRHHCMPYEENGDNVSVDIRLLTFHAVDKLISYFEGVEYKERGSVVISDGKEVPYDP